MELQRKIRTLIYRLLVHSYVMAIVLVAPFCANAMAVAYAESVGIMATNEALSSELFINYSFTPRFALGSRILRFNTADGIRQFYIPEADFLLHRWNNAESQGNLYFSGGYGAQSFQGQTSSASLADVEMDWESRKYYLDANFQDVLASDRRQFFTTRWRVGVAPYLAEFNELNSWFILQLETKPFIDDQPTVTPLVRLFYKNVLVELGSSLQGAWQFNFMIHL